MAAHLAFNTLLTAVAAAMVLVACDRDDNSTGGQRLNSDIASTESRAEETRVELKQGGAEASVALRAGVEKSAPLKYAMPTRLPH